MNNNETGNVYIKKNARLTRKSMNDIYLTSTKNLEEQCKTNRNDSDLGVQEKKKHIIEKIYLNIQDLKKNPSSKSIEKSTLIDSKDLAGKPNCLLNTDKSSIEYNSGRDNINSFSSAAKYLPFNWDIESIGIPNTNSTMREANLNKEFCDIVTDINTLQTPKYGNKSELIEEKLSQIKNKKSTIKGNKNNISLNLNDSMKLTKKKNLRNSVSDINNKTSNLTNKTVNHNRLTDFNKHNDNLVNNLKCNYYHFISRHRKSSWLIGNKRYQGKNGGVYLNEIEEQSNTDSKSRTLLTRNLEEDIGLLRNSSKSIFSTNSIFTKNSKKLQRTNSTIMKKEEITQISDHKMNKIRDILNKMTKGKTDDEIDVELVNRYMNITSISSDVNLTPIIIKRNQFKDNFEKNDYNQAKNTAILLRRVEYSKNLKKDHNKCLKKTIRNILRYSFRNESKLVKIQRWWKKKCLYIITSNNAAFLIQNNVRLYLDKVRPRNKLRLKIFTSLCFKLSKRIYAFSNFIRNFKIYDKNINKLNKLQKNLKGRYYRKTKLSSQNPLMKFIPGVIPTKYSNWDKFYKIRYNLRRFMRIISKLSRRKQFICEVVKFLTSLRRLFFVKYHKETVKNNKIIKFKIIKVRYLSRFLKEILMLTCYSIKRKFFSKWKILFVLTKKRCSVIRLMISNLLTRLAFRPFIKRLKGKLRIDNLKLLQLESLSSMILIHHKTRFLNIYLKNYLFNIKVKSKRLSNIVSNTRYKLKISSLQKWFKQTYSKRNIKSIENVTKGSEFIIKFIYIKYKEIMKKKFFMFSKIKSNFIKFLRRKEKIYKFIKKFNFVKLRGIIKRSKQHDNIQRIIRFKTQKKKLIRIKSIFLHKSSNLQSILLYHFLKFKQHLFKSFNNSYIKKKNSVLRGGLILLDNFMNSYKLYAFYRLCKNAKLMKKIYRLIRGIDKCTTMFLRFYFRYLSSSVYSKKYKKFKNISKNTSLKTMILKKQISINKIMSKVLHKLKDNLKKSCLIIKSNEKCRKYDLYDFIYHINSSETKIKLIEITSRLSIFNRGIINSKFIKWIRCIPYKDCDDQNHYTRIRQNKLLSGDYYQMKSAYRPVKFSQALKKILSKNIHNSFMLNLKSLNKKLVLEKYTKLNLGKPFVFIKKLLVKKNGEHETLIKRTYFKWRSVLILRDVDKANNDLVNYFDKIHKKLKENKVSKQLILQISKIEEKSSQTLSYSLMKWRKHSNYETLVTITRIVQRFLRKKLHKNKFKALFSLLYNKATIEEIKKLSLLVIK